MIFRVSDQLSRSAAQVLCACILAAFAAAPFLCAVRPVSAGDLPAASAAKLPCWRGFNLLEKFTVQGNKPYVEEDFKLISQWGFDFVRLPIDYRCYIKGGNWKEFDEQKLKEIDQAVAWGRKYGIHVCLNLHRAPGYCVSPPREPASLWTDAGAQAVCAAHWAMFARRYKGIPNEYLSFNLLNEPPLIGGSAYYRVVKKLVEAIRKEDPGRLIIADGTFYAGRPVPQLAPLGIAQATRGYAPKTLTHYQAAWMPFSNKLPVPTWPVHGIFSCDQARLWERAVQPWVALASRGVGVMVGEWGAYNRTPHRVTLDWMESCLQNWKRAGFGWALWNFRGPFGIMDSGRSDVQYEDYHGHKLDREMLNLLQRY